MLHVHKLRNIKLFKAEFLKIKKLHMELENCYTSKYEKNSPFLTHENRHNSALLCIAISISLVSPSMKEEREKINRTLLFTILKRSFFRRPNARVSLTNIPSYSHSGTKGESE